MRLESISREHLPRAMAAHAESDDARTAAEDALEAVAHREYTRLRRLAWRFGIPAANADDAVQDVFCKAYAALDSFRGDADMNTWVTRIAINHFTSQRAAWTRRLQRITNWYTLDERPTKVCADAATREAYARAVDIIGRLPAKQRRVFVLRYLEEMSAREVAELLEIPEATVRTRAYAARQKLRRLMKGYEP